MTEPFWRTKTLSQMSASEWESLCDGCGKCCLHKLEDADTGAVFHTDVACRLLDLHSCRCRNYAERRRWVPDCTILKACDVGRFDWLPDSCAYRRVARGADLPAWHPLKTGHGESVHEAGLSVRGRAVSEDDAGPLEDHILDRPL